MKKTIWAGALLALAMWIVTPPVAADEDAAPDAIGKGEIRLNGSITLVTGPDDFAMGATSFVTEAGKTIEFTSSRNKKIALSPAIRLVAAENPLQEVKRDTLKLGAKIGVIGRDGGSGKPFAARLILVQDSRPAFTLGRKVTAKKVVVDLIVKGRAELEARKPAAAARLFQEAATTGANIDDKVGRAVALGSLGQAYEMAGQPQRAMEAYREGLKVSEQLDDKDGQSVAHNFIGNLQLEAGDGKAAIASFKSAIALGGDSPQQELINMQLNLIAALKLDKQRPAVVQARRDLLRLLRGRGLDEVEQGVMLALGLVVLQKPDEATEAFKTASAVYETLKAPKDRAAALTAFGHYYRGRLDKANAAQSFKASLAIYKELGDKEGIEAANDGLEMLKKEDEE